MTPISKSEGLLIKKRIGGVLENFNDLNRHELREALISIGKFCHPHNTPTPKKMNVYHNVQDGNY